MAELRLGLGPGPGPEPGAPALDLVSCSPGQQLEGRREREREGGEEAREDSTETSWENFNWETESERRWRGIRKGKKQCSDREAEEREERKGGEGGGGGLERGQWKSH